MARVSGFIAAGWSVCNYGRRTTEMAAGGVYYWRMVGQGGLCFFPRPLLCRWRELREGRQMFFRLIEKDDSQHSSQEA